MLIKVSGINSETKVFLKDLTTTIKVSESMLGRVLDFQGKLNEWERSIVKLKDQRYIWGTYKPVRSPAN